MSDEAVAIPRRGTPARRAWTRRALVIGVMPAVAVGLGVLTLMAADLGPTQGRPWTDIVGWSFAAVVFIGALGLVCIFDARTRVAGIFTLLASLVINPLTSGLLAGLLGLP